MNPVLYVLALLALGACAYETATHAQDWESMNYGLTKQDETNTGKLNNDR